MRSSRAIYHTILYHTIIIPYYDNYTTPYYYVHHTLLGARRVGEAGAFLKGPRRQLGGGAPLGGYRGRKAEEPGLGSRKKRGFGPNGPKLHMCIYIYICIYQTCTCIYIYTPMYRNKYIHIYRLCVYVHTYVSRKLS